MKAARRAVRDQVLKIVGVERRAGEAPPPSAEGLFPPGSIVRAVHADFTSMMIGGVGSLLLQMLHPSALAGVWDHSDFRKDMAGRLRRTARFVSVTTYGAKDDALAAIARVRAIHEKVAGALPDGTPYAASDPELLRWVHVAETRCFLEAHLRYRAPRTPAADQDRYFAEMASVARLLGSAEPPATRADAEAYLEAMRPRLKWDARTRRVASHLLSQPAVAPSFAPVDGFIFDAGCDLLPDWAAEMHGLGRSPRARRAVRARAYGAGALLRWAMRVDATA
ncbi:oxygenase MpaB family protein [Chenggangzhangella methanolivorans]|uniref:Oxygenase MpaB family protein n=1 Tax=Chenggangzhangella methanolivorans TaxID=1437009 RepID=A0A9E6R8S8_9HYPH|nr:oxygenase MpaB family protein [Chenggangzhangella methanolivorans]QZN98913.1 oxygenase MpaB family protein [Chenggangzhangella methanolivorans]